MILLVLLGCQQPVVSATAPLRPGQVLLAHTNDLHAHFLPERAPWLDGAPDIGGFVALDAHLNALRQEGETLYLDAGDLLSGTPLMELDERGVQGGAMLSLMEAVGCAAFVLGNHEFDRGAEHTRRFVAASEIPVLSANLLDAQTAGPIFDGVRPAITFRHNDLTVGVFGLTTPSMSRLTDAETASRMLVVPPAEAAAAQVAALEDEVDLVVALTHLGIAADRSLAAEVPGIDLIIGGHSHTALEAPEQVGQTWIVQAGSYGRQLGVLRLDVYDGQIAELEWELRDLLPDALPADPDDEVVALTARWARLVEARFGEEIGQAPAPILRGEGESPMGRLAAEIVRQGAGADVGIYNAGGLRADLLAGPVTLGDLYQVFPFSNEVVSFEVTGAVLVTMLVRTAGRQLTDWSVPQWSGVEASWRVRLGAPELISAAVGGAPLELDRTYTVATNSFVAEHWQGNLGRDPGTITGHAQTVLEAAAQLAAAGPLQAPQTPTLLQIMQ